MFQARYVSLACFLWATSFFATANMAIADEGDAVVIDLEQRSKRSLYPIAVPMGANSDPVTAAEVAKIASFDLGMAGWFKVLDPRSFLADLPREGLSIEPQKWKDVGAFGVVKFRVSVTGSDVDVTFRLFEVEKGNTPVLSKTYTGRAGHLRKLVHRWCNEVVRYYTKEDGFFSSKIAFVARSKSGRKQIYAMDFDGFKPHALTKNRSINLLPDWSPNGARIAFTSYMRNNPDLYVVSASGGRPQRLSKFPGMNTGAAWSPDGASLAVTLSKDGNPEIYLISATSGATLRRLTDNRAIDTSPTWSPNGREIAFVSDREGGPQIYVMNVNGSNIRRVSKNGDYNTTPVFSPRADSRVLAYTTRDEGHYDIVTLDLNTGDMVRITQGQGNNEEPSFAPNGRAIAFASVREEGSGIYIANADGSGEQVRVWSGRATSIDWGPALP